jgi:hypothetical protein
MLVQLVNSRGPLFIDMEPAETSTTSLGFLCPIFFFFWKSSLKLYKFLSDTYEKQQALPQGCYKFSPISETFYKSSII